MASNYPPGVSGMEFEISGYGHTCQECGCDVEAVDNRGLCVICIEKINEGFTITKGETNATDKQ